MARASAGATAKPLTCGLSDRFISYRIVYLETRVRLEYRLYLFSVIT
jgi:hypothetical protein